MSFTTVSKTSRPETAAHYQAGYAAQHDWFAEVAEDYVRYVFSKCRRFEVFSGGKGTADLAVLDRKTGRLLRVEVRSKDKNRHPRRKKTGRLKEIAEGVADVHQAGHGRLAVRLCLLDANGRRIPGFALEDKDMDRLEEWWERFLAQGDREAEEWRSFGRRHFALAFGDNEPEYTLADCKPRTRE